MGRGGFDWGDAAAVGVVGLAIAGGAGAAMFADDSMLAMLAAVAVAGGALILARRRLAPPFLSPVTLVASGLAAIGFLGAVFYSGVAEAPGGAGATLALSSTESRRTLLLLIVSAAAVAVGAAAVSLAAPRQAPPASAAAPLLSPQARGWALACVALPLAVLLATGGLADVWSRPLYIANAVQDLGWRPLAEQLTIGAVLLLGYLSRTTRGSARVLVVVLATAHLLYYFGQGSRMLALCPVLFALGAYAVRTDRRWTRVVIGSVIVAIYLIGLPLYLRGLPAHGIANYLPYLADFPSHAPPWATSVKNILVSYPIMGRTYLAPPIGDDAFWVSVNPLPGGLVGWYDLAGFLRINDYTPYAAVGEVGNQGWPSVVVYWVAVGGVLAVLERQVVRLLAHGHRLLPLPVIGLSGMFLLYSIQYNLRSSTRMLYYALAASALVWVSVRVMDARARRAAEEDERQRRLLDRLAQVRGRLPVALDQ